MSKKWFFKRSNARVSWDNAPDEARWFSVDRSGRGDWGVDKPRPDTYLAVWVYRGGYAMACYVGDVCLDWQTLIFERPQEALQPQPPVITAEEWRAIRLLLPGAIGVAKDINDTVYAFVKRPAFTEVFGWIMKDRFMIVPVLRDRFADIHWRESLVEYDGDGAAEV